MAARKLPIDRVPGEMCEEWQGRLDCQCRDAVRRCFDRMTEIGLPRTHALDAASRIYRHYHPEVSQDLGRLTVEAWVAPGRLH